MRGSSIKIVRHIIKGELDVACVWGSRELISDAFFPSLYAWNLVQHSLHCRLKCVVQFSLCPDHPVRIPKTNIVNLCL